MAATEYTSDTNMSSPPPGFPVPSSNFSTPVGYNSGQPWKYPSKDGQGVQYPVDANGGQISNQLQQSMPHFNSQVGAHQGSSHQADYYPQSGGGQYQLGATGGGQYQPGAIGGGQYQPGATGGGQYWPSAPGGGQYQPGATGGGQYLPGATGGGQYQLGDTGGGQYLPGATGGGQYQPGATGGGQHSSSSNYRYMHQEGFNSTAYQEQGTFGDGNVSSYAHVAAGSGQGGAYNPQTAITTQPHSLNQSHQNAGKVAFPLKICDIRNIIHKSYRSKSISFS